MPDDGQEGDDEGDDHEEDPQLIRKLGASVVEPLVAPALRNRVGRRRRSGVRAARLSAAGLPTCSLSGTQFRHPLGD